MPVVLDIRALDHYSDELDKTRKEINRISMQIAANRRQQVAANTERRKALQLIAKRDAAEKSILIAEAQRLGIEIKGEKDKIKAAENTARVEKKAADDAARNAARQIAARKKVVQSQERMNREIQKTVQAARRARAEAGLLAHEFDRFGNVVRKSTQSVKNSNNSFRVLSRSLVGLKGYLAGIGIEAAGYALINFGRNAARASIQIDSYTRALAVLEGSASTAEKSIRDLQDLADLPGLRFKDAVEGILALKAVQIEGDLAKRALVELGNAAAFTGAQFGEFERGLLGLRQIAARGRVSQEELNQITENISIASTVLRNEFGTVLAEDIQQILDETGQTSIDFVETLVSGFEKLERFPIDAPSVKLKNLSNSFFEFKAAIGDTFLPVVAGAVQGLTALFDSLTDGTKAFNDFFDIIDEQHNALLNASESARAFAIRLSEINTAVGQSEAVENRITQLQRLTTALRIEQSEVSHSSQEYLEYAERIRTAANEIDLLRSIQQAQSGSTINQDLINRQTQALEKAKSEIQRYENALARAREEAVGETNPAIQQLERRLEGQRTTASTLRREIELLTNGFQDIALPVNTAAEAIANGSLAIAKLRAESEDALADRNFSAALTASNAYYDARIAKAQDALAEEVAGTEDYNKIETEIFELRRQRLQAEQRLETERQKVVTQTADLRIESASKAREVEVQSFKDAADAGDAYIEQLKRIASPRFRREFYEYVQVFQDLGLSFDAAAEHARQAVEFNRKLIVSYQDTTTQAERLAKAHAETFESVSLHIQTATTEMRNFIDEAELATQTLQLFDRNRLSESGQRTPQGLNRPTTAQIPRADISGFDFSPPDTFKEGAEAYRQSLVDQERSLERSLNQQYRQYQTFYNRVGDIATDALFGRIESFKQLALSVSEQVLRFIIRTEVAERISAARTISIDTSLTNARIANQARLQAAIARTAAANQVSAGGLGAGGLGGIGLPNIGGLASGGAGALGVAGLLFPQEFRNLFSGIGTSLVQPIAEAIGGSEANSIGNLFIRFDDGTVRKIRDRQNTITNRNR